MSKTFTVQESEELLSSLRRLVSAEPREIEPELAKPLLLSLGSSQEPKDRISLGFDAAPEVAVTVIETDDPPLVLTPALRVVQELEPLPLLLSRFSNTPVTAAPLAAVEKKTHSTLESLIAAAEAPTEEVEEAPFIALTDEVEPPAQQANKAQDAEEHPEEPEEEPLGHWSEQNLPDVAWIAEASGEWDDEESLAFAAHLPAEAEPEDAPDLEWAAQAEAEVHAALTPPRAAPQGEVVEPYAVTAYEPNSLAMMDEDTLREIVRQIIREELSGALGERITRNVRKLVRVEINRAMTTTSLE